MERDFDPEKFKFYRESIEYAKEAAKTILPKEIKNWEQLNQSIINLAEEKKKPEFQEKIIDTWKEFAVSGVLQFDKKEGKSVLRPFTDLDGKCALGILKEAGIDTSNLTYVRPGEYLKGAINLDTGDKFGVVYEEPSYTTYIDHHAPGTKEVTSTTEIVYKTMVGLRLLEKSEPMDRLVDFVTKIDNRKYPPEEFLRSAKTILGLQRDLDFGKLKSYFKEHKSPTEELTAEEFEKYGLKETAEKQQEIVNEAMKTLERIEKEGKVIETKYGKVVINVNNGLKVGASAAYTKYDGIINFSPEKSFAVTLKKKIFDEKGLKRKLADKFQGKIIRGKMWIYNGKEPLKVSLEELINSLQEEKQKERTEETEKEKLVDSLISKNLYKKENGEIVSVNYYAKTKAYKNNLEYVIPELIIGSSKNIKPGQHTASVIERFDEFEETGKTWVDERTGLDRYVLSFSKEGVPIYTFDNHTHALFAWAEALKAGFIEDEALLIRFDRHSDLDLPNLPIEKLKNLTDLAEIKKYIVQGEINESNFTLPAVLNKTISKMHYIGPQWEEAKSDFLPEMTSFENVKDYQRKYEDILREIPKEKIILDIDLDIIQDLKDSDIDFLAKIGQQAGIVTLATSPFYISQEVSIPKAQKLVSRLEK